MIKELIMYTVVCNCCGEDSNSNTDYSCYADENDANEVAMNLGWIKERGEHYCLDCYSYDDNDNLIIKSKPNEG